MIHASHRYGSRAGEALKEAKGNDTSTITTDFCATSCVAWQWPKRNETW